MYAFQINHEASTLPRCNPNTPSYKNIGLWELGNQWNSEDMYSFHVIKFELNPEI